MVQNNTSENIRLFEDMKLRIDNTDSDFYKALDNMLTSMTTCDFKTFISEYVAEQKLEIKADTWNNILHKAVALVLNKIAGYNFIWNIAGAVAKVADKYYDDFNQTDLRMTEVGNCLVWDNIRTKLLGLSADYESELKNSPSISNAMMYHTTVDKYSVAASMLCKHGASFIDSFESAYLKISPHETGRVVLYLMYHKDLNTVLQTKELEANALYEELETVKYDLKSLKSYYSKPICCRLTKSEREQIVSQKIDDVINRAEDYFTGKFSSIKKFVLNMVACPTRTEVYDNQNNLIAKVYNGRISIKDFEKYDDISCLSIPECNSDGVDINSYCTLITVPEGKTSPKVWTKKIV